MIIPILTTLALAELSARDDARQIRRNIIIDHVMQWYIRALVVLGVCLVFCVPWLSIGLAGLFSAVFRWRLNRLRGLDVRYIAPWSSFYDRAFHAAVLRMRHGFWISVEFLGEERDIYFGGRGIDPTSTQCAKDDIHRAGTIAYIFEGLVFAGVLTIHLV